MSVMRGRSTQDVIKNKDEGKLWDELVMQLKEINDEGCEVHVPSD